MQISAGHVLALWAQWGPYELIWWSFPPVVFHSLCLLQVSSHSSPGFPNLWRKGPNRGLQFRFSPCIMCGCGSLHLLHLLLEKVSLLRIWQGTRLGGQHKSMGNRFVDFIVYLFTFDPPCSVLPLVSASSRKCKNTQAPFPGVSLKLNQASAGHAYKFCTTTATARPVDRTHWRWKGLWLGWCPGFYFCRLQSAFSCQRD